MVYSIGFKNQNASIAFGNGKKAENKCENHDKLLYDEKKKHPITTSAKIKADKLVNAFTKYPAKGMQGSKNANFYEFLTMGTVPYLVGSATMIGVFNLASKFFDTPAAVNASKLGKKMGIGVAVYGVAKELSKKLVEAPVNMKYGIDVNLPYRKKIDELPEERNKNNLVAHEYHKAFESVDFPRWDLFYNNESFGSERNSYFEKVGKKMGLKEEDLGSAADQKVKPLIKEKLVKTKLFSTLSSYLWAGVGVGVAMQKPWENLVINPVKRMANYKNYKKLAEVAKDQGKNIAKYDNFAKDFGKKFVESCKDFVNNGSKSTKIAGRALLGAAVGMTLLGNFSTLLDFNKDKKTNAQASTSLIDESKEKVVC